MEQRGANDSVDKNRCGEHNHGAKNQELEAKNGTPVMLRQASERKLREQGARKQNQ